LAVCYNNLLLEIKNNRKEKENHKHDHGPLRKHEKGEYAPETIKSTNQTNHPTSKHPTYLGK
jgi:hypothetical protein